LVSGDRSHSVEGEPELLVHITGHLLPFCVGGDRRVDEWLSMRA
jgi:hypothetical protein